MERQFRMRTSSWLKVSVASAPASAIILAPLSRTASILRRLSWMALSRVMMSQPAVQFQQSRSRRRYWCQRWTTEENFQAGKGLAGLDEHQVRTWTAWHRWVTLAMLALAFLTIAAAVERQVQPPAAGLIPLTRNEIAVLFGSLVVGPGGRHRLRWSAWRRRHQHRARACHYERQSEHDPRHREFRILLAGVVTAPGHGPTSRARHSKWWQAHAP
jgi:hypothetical protein